MMRPRLLRAFRPSKPICSLLRPQQVTTRSFSSTSTHQRYRKKSSTDRGSKKKQAAHDRVPRENLPFSAAENFRQRGKKKTLVPEVPDRENAVSDPLIPSDPLMPSQEGMKALWKDGRPPNEAGAPKDLRGIGGHIRSLFRTTSSSYKNGIAQSAQAIEKERPAQAAAAKFFQEPSELLYSAPSHDNHKENDLIPEIVIVGASNAGKSHFLNALVGDFDLAKVSYRAGKTTTMNAYGVGPRPKIAPELIRKGDAPPKHSLVLMDTPGYGYRSKASWGETIVKYLIHRKTLRGAVILIPADKDNYGMDTWMLKTLARTMTRTLVVITKADKCGEAWPTECLALSEEIEKELERQDRLAPGKWREGSERITSIYATAAGMETQRRMGIGAGIGGVRLAILELAGYGGVKGRVEKQDETKAYTGEIVSFDDIVWKT
ncbi:EngB-type G domain-containing protein [Fusarium sp. LHS14.1]|nr:EngB-type G domain-containing protein [Fusarium sp. LHS14.1]